FSVPGPDKVNFLACLGVTLIKKHDLYTASRQYLQWNRCSVTDRVFDSGGDEPTFEST
ncbi:hypothetical protein SK128_023911, partial [Halocaridina rubra]